MSTGRPTKAVIPAAGLGTRFLPATKAMPKEMLPVVDKPAIQYVVEEAVAAGLNDVLMITGRNKTAIENHFDRTSSSSWRWRRRATRTAWPASTSRPNLADIHYVRQGDPRGLGHAVLVATQHVGDEPFAVLLGDDLIDERDPLLRPHDRGAGEARRVSVVALMEVPRPRSTSTAARQPPPPTTRTCSPSPVSSRSRRPTRRRATSPSSVATCCTRRSSTCCETRRPDAAARSS